MTVRLFARLRELCGRESLTLEIDGDATPEGCFRALAASEPRLAALRDRLLVAVNEEYADWYRPLAEGDEVVFVPPVSGGAGGCHVEVTDGPIDTRAWRARVGGPAAGAVVTFEGIVRDHHEGRAVSHLEYEGHRSMSRRQLATIAREALERHPVEAVAVVHRLGRLEVGECSVFIAVAAAHRDAAFEATRYVIDELKKRVPIWKRESGPDGSYWVEGPARVPAPRA